VTPRHVCCAVDFSEASRVALEEAARIAARDGAALTLVHAFPRPRPLAAEALAFTAGELEAEARRERVPVLEEWRVAAERLAPGVKVASELACGDAGEEVVRVATARGCDLVVVGTHSRTGLRRLVLGSVAEHVVRASPASVLVARAQRSGR
jgi:nucleotide-binding universal stress UspA family protein